MTRILAIVALLAGCSPLDNPGVRKVGIDLVAALPAEPGDDLADLDLNVLAAATGRVEAQPIYDDGFIEGVGLPPAPDGRSFYAVFGFADDPRAEFAHDPTEVDLGPPGFAWDAVVGPLRREDDGHTSVLFLGGDVDPFDLGALRTALIVISSADAPTSDTATIVLAGEFEFVETGAVAAGHHHGP